MDVEKTPASDAPAFENDAEETRQAWVALRFERLPLNEAMSNGTITRLIDGGTGYS